MFITFNNNKLIKKKKSSIFAVTGFIVSVFIFCHVVRGSGWRVGYMTGRTTDG